MLRLTKSNLIKGGIALTLFIAILLAIVWSSRRRKNTEQEQLLKDQETQIKEIRAEQEIPTKESTEVTPNSDELDSLHKRVDELEYLIRPIQKLNEEAAKGKGKRAPACKAEQLAWEEAKKLKTIEGYKAFLSQTFPSKVFRGIATRRLNELEREA